MIGWGDRDFPPLISEFVFLVSEFKSYDGLFIQIRYRILAPHWPLAERALQKSENALELWHGPQIHDLHYSKQ
jgi:hypothetical protein